MPHRSIDEWAPRTAASLPPAQYPAECFPSWLRSWGQSDMHVASWRIVLKKSFFDDDLKFLGPLVRLSRCEVWDLINCRKSDRWPSYRFYRAWEQLKSPMCYICEIFGSPRFGVFQHNRRKAAVHDWHLRIDLLVWNPCGTQCVCKERKDLRHNPDRDGPVVYCEGGIEF